MDSELDFHTARALLEWQLEMGVDEAIGDAPVDRYALDTAPPRAKAATPPPKPAQKTPDTPAATPERDAVAAAEQAARAAADLSALQEAMARYEYCDLKEGARTLVFADGIAGAPVMIIGEAPGREEDREGKPFVGQTGQLLDRMLAAIGMGRADDHAPVYITNVLPWRPPQNRSPDPAEIAMMLPFLRRHIELAKPKLLVLMGNTPCQALIGRSGITRLRGQWAKVADRPALPMFHPAYLLRTPAAKRESWADLLALKARLRDAQDA